MRVFSVIECSVFLIFVGYLVHEYSSKKVPMYVKIISYISWVISFGFVFLLPLDIYYVKTFDNIFLKCHKELNNISFRLSTMKLQKQVL